MSYLARETLLSALINGAISVAFFLGVFGGTGSVPVWGTGNYAFDFVPQSFAIGLMAALVPGLLCRKALLSGRLTPALASPPAAGIIALRALVCAVAAAIVGGALAALALWLSGVNVIGYGYAFGCKVAYGAGLGALVTRFTLNRLLAGA
jgi:hypothetical protein